MFTKTVILDITAEDFEMPPCTADLGDLIEESCDVYHQVLLTDNKGKRLWKHKVNELIDEYNDRRGCKIYNYIR